MLLIILFIVFFLISLNVALFVWVFKTKGQKGSILVVILLLLTFTFVGIVYGITRNFNSKKNINK